MPNLQCFLADLIFLQSWVTRSHTIRLVEVCCHSLVLTKHLLTMVFFRFLYGDGCCYHSPRLLTILSSRLDIYVHHWRYCRCRPLQRYFEGGQLPESRSPPSLMDRYHPHRWYSRRSTHGHSPECSSLYPQIKSRFQLMGLLRMRSQDRFLDCIANITYDLGIDRGSLC
jgi:hypothetical protein